jgi:hypothetical protein
MPKKKSRSARKLAHWEPDLETILRTGELALSLIKPSPEQWDEAVVEIVDAIRIISEIDPANDRVPRAVVREELRKFAHALHGAVAALTTPPHWPLPIGVHWNELGSWDKDQLLSVCDELTGMAQVAEAEARRIARKGRQGRVPSEKRLAAAEFAYDLLESYGIKPTLSPTGPFFQLTAALYEGGTGIADADLSRVCRAVFHEFPVKYPK